MSAAAWPALLLAAAALSPAEERGREIYLHGGVPAVVGDVPVAAPMACAGCHGAEGQGGGEGGVRAPAITWDALAHASAARPAYDPRALVRAVAMGIGAGGRPLAAPMPRYQLRREDADDLVAFLRRLGTLRDPGLSGGALVLGVLLPASNGTPPGAAAPVTLEKAVERRDATSSGTGAPASGGREEASSAPPPPGTSPRTGAPVSSAREAVRSAALAWAAEVNARGGLYTRRVELRFADQPSAADAPFLYLGWGDDAVARWMAEHEVPFLRTAGGTDQAFPLVFDLGPSRAEEVEQLIRFAAGQGEVPISAQGPMAISARAACRPPGCTPEAPVRSVLCLDAASIRAVPGRALALIPSSLAEEAVAAAPPGAAIIAARAAPSDIDSALAAAYHLAPAHLADQWNLLAAARLAEAVLQRAGAGVSRASFVATLQQTRRFVTGFSPPLTFDSEHSRGTEAVRLLRFDPRTGALMPVE